jgi:hypothetical protein
MNRSRSRSLNYRRSVSSSSSLFNARSRSRIFTVRNFLAAVAIVVVLYIVVYANWYFFHETDTGRSILMSMGYLPPPSQKMIREVHERQEKLNNIRRNNHERRIMESKNTSIAPKVNFPEMTGKTVMHMGVKVDCGLLRPCKDSLVKPEDGCCPDGIHEKVYSSILGKNGPDECDAPFRQTQEETLKAMRECGYSV